MLRLNAMKENINIFIIRCDIYLASSAAYREIVIKLFCIEVYMALAQNWTSRGFI